MYIWPSSSPLKLLSKVEGPLGKPCLHDRCFEHSGAVMPEQLVALCLSEKKSNATAYKDIVDNFSWFMVRS